MHSQSKGKFTKSKEPQSKQDHFKPMKDRVKHILNRQPVSIESFDGKPLNFSFKKIRNLRDFLTQEPNQGKRKKTTVSQQEIKQDKKQNTKGKQESKADREQQAKPEETEQVTKKKQMKGPEIIRTIALASPFPNQSTNAQPLTKQVVRQEEKKKDQQRVKVSLSCTSLFFSYNKIQSISNLFEVVNELMFSPEKLMWLDLSHNRIELLDCVRMLTRI